MWSVIPGFYFVKGKKKKRQRRREITHYSIKDTYIVNYCPFDLTKSKFAGLEARSRSELPER